MKLKTISFFCGALALMSLTSCHSTTWDEDNKPAKPIYYFSQPKADNFIAVQNKTDLSWKYYDGCDIEFLFNENDNSCSIAITDMQIDADQRSSFTFLNIPQVSYNNASVKGAQAVNPFQNTGIGSGSTYTISDLTITCILDEKRTFGKKDVNGVPTPNPVGVQAFIAFTINNQYKVRVVQRDHYFYGLTSSVCATNEFEPFYTQKSIYRLTLAPNNGAARLTIEEAQFISGMPAGITMDFSGLSFALTDDGIRIASSSLIPTVGNRPFEVYEVTGLYGNVSYADKLRLNFTCPHVPIPMTSDNTYSFNVTVDATYTYNNPAK